MSHAHASSQTILAAGTRYGLAIAAAFSALVWLAVYAALA
jgi:hypothetical protein